MRTKYWIVGGEYVDTSFDRLLDGTAEVMGPYATRETALNEWKRLASETKANCHTRYTIAEELSR